jgi:uncharacterized membrane protein YkoI
MRAVFIYAVAAAAALACACDGGEDPPAIDETEAARIAEAAVGGVPGEVERTTDRGIDVWRVFVAMTNGATMEVDVDVHAGDVVGVEDKVGPFDYADFTPIDGVIGYDAIKAEALDEIEGTIEAFLFKRKPDAAIELEYEFYLRDDDGQLWEILFDATDGTATDLEPKPMVDP